MCNKEGLININVSWEDGNGWDPKTMFHGWSLISKYRWVTISVCLHVYCWEFRKTQFCWLLFTLWNRQWGRSAAESDRGSGPLVKVFSAYAHSTVWHNLPKSKALGPVIYISKIKCQHSSRQRLNRSNFLKCLWLDVVSIADEGRCLWMLALFFCHLKRLRP